MGRGGPHEKAERRKEGWERSEERGAWSSLRLVAGLAMHLRSYRQRNRELSTVAHARRMLGKAPQKHTILHDLCRSTTSDGKSFITGVSERSWAGHCHGGEGTGSGTGRIEGQQQSPRQHP